MDVAHYNVFLDALRNLLPQVLVRLLDLAAFVDGEREVGLHVFEVKVILEAGAIPVLALRVQRALALLAQAALLRYYCTLWKAFRFLLFYLLLY